MLISFEGIDGCGKSTQIKLLKTWLEERGYHVHVYREPGGAELSETIRKLLLDPAHEIDPVTELLLFSSARSHLTHSVIEPLLKQQKIVILDRFYDSTTAYQGFGRNVISQKDIQIINRIATHHITPDITFYLSLSIEDAQERRGDKDGKGGDRMERSGRKFYENVIKGYEWIASNEPERVITINASRERSSTAAEVQSHIKDWLNNSD